MTQPPSDEYREGYDRIWGPKEKGTPAPVQPSNRMRDYFCCGRSMILCYENTDEAKPFYKCRECKMERTP